MAALRSLLLVTSWFGIAAVAACSSHKGDSSAGDDGSGSSNPTGPGGGGSASNPSGQNGGGTNQVGGGSSNPDTSNDPANDPAIPYQAFDINHVLSTGQSNSVAHEGRPVISTTQMYTNLSFDVGVMTSGDCDTSGCRTYQKPNGFIPLVEGDSFWYPVETMSSGLANEAAKLVHAKYQNHDVLVSLAGRNGLTYWCLRKGGCDFLDPTYLNTFDENMRQVEDAMALAKAAGKTYVVRVATAIHGESDDYAYATNTQEFPLDGTDGTPQSIKSYADGLLEWQRDYEAGAKQRTGQTLPVPLFISQFSSWNDFDRGTVQQFQFEAMMRSRGMVTITTPGYILDFADDCRHYTNKGEQRLGEYFGKAYARWVVEGKKWMPLHPENATIAGSVITAKFYVPAPPLVFDTDYVVDPGNYGFEVADDAGNDVAISKVELDGADKVKVTLAAAPTGAVKLRYAFKHAAHTCAGRFVGPRGNLRDSDKTPSQYGYDLANWSVHFEIPVAK